jgi:hypothetical protein
MTTQKAITGTPEQISDYFFSLDGKIQRDKDGIELIKVIYHGDLCTLIYTPKVKKTRKQPSLKKLRTIASEWWLNDHDMHRNEKGLIVVSSSRGVYQEYFTGTGFQVQRWLKKQGIEKFNKQSEINRQVYLLQNR